MKTAYLGGIINRRNKGAGFDVIFKDKAEAQKYKEMMITVLKMHGYEINDIKGYYDRGTNNE